MSTLKIVTVGRARTFFAQFSKDLAEHSDTPFSVDVQNSILSSIESAYGNRRDTSDAGRFRIRFSIAVIEYKGSVPPQLTKTRTQLMDAVDYYQHHKNDEGVEDLKGEWEGKQRNIIPFPEYMAQLEDE